MRYHPVNLIYSAIEKQPLPCEPVEGICVVTGVYGPSVPRKELFGKSFTNLDLLARPDSDMVGIEAYQALKHPSERKNSWFCDGKTFRKLTRIEVREMVFAESLPERWIGYATTSYKKHGALRTPINTGNSRLWLFEMRVVDCTDMKKVKAWWSTLNTYLRLGFGRSILETLDCPPYLIQKIGLGHWLGLHSWARDKYQSGLYQFLCYLLPSQEELKNERT